VRVLSRRWWFENRTTGQLTIVQIPNWEIWAIGAAWLIVRLTDGGSAVGRVADSAGVGLWLVWGADEILRGVNPWRRLLGAAVIGWQLVGLIT